MSKCKTDLDRELVLEAIEKEINGLNRISNSRLEVINIYKTLIDVLDIYENSEDDEIKDVLFEFKINELRERLNNLYISLSLNADIVSNDKINMSVDAEIYNTIVYLFEVINAVKELLNKIEQNEKISVNTLIFEFINNPKIVALKFEILDALIEEELFYYNHDCNCDSEFEVDTAEALFK